METGLSLFTGVECATRRETFAQLPLSGPRTLFEFLRAADQTLTSVGETAAGATLTPAGARMANGLALTTKRTALFSRGYENVFPTGCDTLFEFDGLTFELVTATSAASAQVGLGSTNAVADFRTAAGVAFSAQTAALLEAFSIVSTSVYGARNA